MAAGSKALPASLTGYTGHPLTATLYAKPGPPPFAGSRLIAAAQGAQLDRWANLAVSTKWVWRGLP